MPQIDLERIFTRKDYTELMDAVKSRREYAFSHSKQGTYYPHPSTGVYMSVEGRKCDNGIWKDDYLFIFTCCYKDCGMSNPYGVEELVSYEKFIADMYNGIDIRPPKTHQYSFTDMEM